jgi:hypothetical protein
MISHCHWYEKGKLLRPTPTQLTIYYFLGMVDRKKQSKFDYTEPCYLIEVPSIGKFSELR